MLKAGLGSSQRSTVAARGGSPKAPAAAAATTGATPASPLTPPASCSSSICTSLRRATWAPQLAPSPSAAAAAAAARTLFPPPAAVSTSFAASAATNGAAKQAHQHGNGNHHNGHGNGHANGSNGSNGNGHRSHGGGAAAGAGDLLSLVGESEDSGIPLRDAATAVRVHVVVPRCTTVPGEHLVLVGDSEALGCWDVRRGLRLTWCAGHMHTATFTMPLTAAGQQALKAKLVLVHGREVMTWEPGHDRSIELQPPGTSTSGSTSASSNGRAGKVATAEKSTAAAAAAGSRGGGAIAHDYVVVCHWGHTEATSVLVREVPGEVLVMEQRLGRALAELRTARSAAAASQEKLQRMAQDLANSERAARHSADQLAELQAKHSAMATELAEAKAQAKVAVAEAAAAKAAAAAASKAAAVNVAEVETRVSQRYEGRMAELKQQLEGVKAQYSSEVSSLQQKLEASLSKEAEAQEMVKSLREIVQKDVARLRTELAQLVDEYIAARQQLQEQAQQIEASEKLRMQQIDGLSSEIKNLITKYNSAQSTIAEQQRLLEELQGTRGVSLPVRAADQAQQVHVPPAPDSQAGRGWRADWARLSKLSAANGAPATTAANTR
ncbi:hypothetical protein PLESTB_000564700 [Pleodorina starrii]|uniref:CBM20 domain-containing protein n=1 Tax=Pleodorina starrii TaxID=330485 RepID=A0A9W6BI52_9CHLO|nr:hypothetical protein PLESTM_000289700 [Pleodorina starrii]GLC51936.1 hypothetical protein PLESTB_000564700 [Pleodorina starrii]GLC68512.1 hypothetical protein PLESTF_000700300 [Pleodorina starrii]